MKQAESIAGANGERPGTLAVWMQATRPATLSVSSIAVLVGSTAAIWDGYFSFDRFILALVGAVAIQAGTNIINDYYDYQSGADPADLAPHVFGPSLVIQRGLLTADQAWLGGIAAFAIGSAIGLWLTYECGWPVLLIGVLGVACGYFYTAQPVALAYRGLGDIASFLFLGPAIVLGAYYVMALRFAWGAVAVSVAMGCLGSAILQANNLRDIETDLQHGKRTMATIFGRRGAIRQLIAFNVIAYLVLLLGVLGGDLPWLALLVLLTVGRAAAEVSILSNETEPDKLGTAVVHAAELHRDFGLLLAFALVLGAGLS